MLLSYRIARFYARFPGLILVALFAICVAAVAVTFLTCPLPDFSEPTLGFKTQGSVISSRATALHKIYESLDKNLNGKGGPEYPLARFPSDFHHLSGGRKSRSVPWEQLVSRNKSTIPVSHSKDNSTPQYCDPSGEILGDYIHFIFRVDGALDSVETIQELCEAETRLTNLFLVGRLSNLCRRKNDSCCCAPWHLGGIVAQLAKVEHCSNLSESQIHTWMSRILTPKNRSQRYMRSTVDAETNLIRTAREYFLPEDLNNGFNYTPIFVPISHWDAEALEKAGLTAKFSDRLSESLSFRQIRMEGMELGMKLRFFMQYLLKDSMFGIVAVFIVWIVTWLYSGDILFTIAAIVGIQLSVGLSLFLYFVVFRIQFFPFMNLLAFILLIGVGTDDAFIMRRAWRRAKEGMPEGEVDEAEVIRHTLKHAWLGMGVTSGTTACAFFSNLISNITVIRSFGIFAGITILSNYVLVVTWLPSVLVLIDRFHAKWSLCRLPGKISVVQNKIHDCFEATILFLIVKLRYLLLLAFLGLTLGAGLVFFKYPGLQLPSKDYLQFFKSSHPFERYEADLRNRFRFSEGGTHTFPLPIQVVWGVKPSKASGFFDPKGEGSVLELWDEEEFGFASNSALVWLREFCDDLSHADFVLNSTRLEGNCFVKYFMDSMTKKCSEISIFGVSETNRPCCAETPFPYRKGVFDTCLAKGAEHYRENLLDAVNGAFFRNNSKVAVIIVGFQSRYNFTISYRKMDVFYKQVNEWVSQRLANGPKTVRNGWFVSAALDLYDLKAALVRGTMLAVPMAVGVAVIFLFACIRNFVVSLLAAAVIAGIIFSTGAALTLMGWELNVLESTIVILAVGLSFDFTLHYAVFFCRLSPSGTAEAKIGYGISQVGGPIFMSAVTTAIPGIVMLPSTTLAYYQIGVFLVIISLISWSFSTFFFNAILAIVGPYVEACSVQKCGKENNPKNDESFSFLKQDEQRVGTNGHDTLPMKIENHD